MASIVVSPLTGQLVTTATSLSTTPSSPDLLNRSAQLTPPGDRVRSYV